MKKFDLRLNVTYEGKENNIAELNVDVLKENGWEILELNTQSPGFMLYINGLFSCQHLYMRTNSAERNIVLASAEGELKIETNDTWHIQKIQVNFEAQIKLGSLSDDDKAYILERMHHCPVSSNLPEGVVIDNQVAFLSE